MNATGTIVLTVALVTPLICLFIFARRRQRRLREAEEARKAAMPEWSSHLAAMQPESMPELALKIAGGILAIVIVAGVLGLVAVAVVLWAWRTVFGHGA